jgi:hypothetical protein
MVDLSAKEWRVRAVQEEDLTVYAKRLQSILNKMEADGFDFTVEGPGANLVMIEGEPRFMSLITGSKDRIEKPIPGFSGPKLVVTEEK